MTDFAREFVMSAMGSILAALLLGLTGLVATRFGKSRESAQHGLKALRLIDIPPVPGPVRRVLKPKLIALALLLAIVMMPLTGFLSGEPIVSISSSTTPVQADQFRWEAKNIMSNVRYEADSILQDSESQAQGVMRGADYEARPLLDSEIIPSQEEGKRIILRATERANRIIAWGQEKAATVLREAEKEAEYLRQQAVEAKANETPIGVAGADSGIGAFFTSVVRGLLLFAYLGAIAHAFGLAVLTTQGFFAVGLIVLLAGVSAALGGALGILDLFGPLLIASALFAGCRRDQELSTGEVVLNSPWILYRRFSVALVLTFGVILVGFLTGLVSSGAVTYLLTSKWEVVHAVMEELVGSAPPSEDSALFSMAIGTFVGYQVSGFFLNWFGAISGAVFLSILAGPPSEVSAVSPVPTKNTAS